MADGGHIPKRGITSIAADIFKCSDRYARMYITIAERAIPSVLNAVITPASNKRIKNNHITVKCCSTSRKGYNSQYKDRRKKLASFSSSSN